MCDVCHCTDRMVDGSDHENAGKGVKRDYLVCSTHFVVRLLRVFVVVGVLLGGAVLGRIVVRLGVQIGLVLEGTSKL